MKPCHGGTCRTGPYGDYSCRCSAGWTGQNCSDDVDECGVAASGGMPLCNHGATCVNTPGSFSCNCIPGYTGMHSLTISCHSCIHVHANIISQGQSLHPVHTKVCTIMKNSQSFFNCYEV